MAFGLGTLRLSPRDFWSMTPRELASARDGVLGHVDAGSLSRDAFHALQAQFPD
jgi:uncharacterized phage protein (TIGR02216 family)